MAQRYAPADALLDGGDGAFEKLKLLFGVVNVGLVGLICNGKVREHTFDIEVRHAAAVNYAGNARFKMPPCAQNAEARHAGVDLDMHAQLCAELGRGCIVFVRLGKAGDGLRDVVGYQVRHLLGGRVSEDEDGHYDAVCAQLHRLIEA